MNKTVLVTGAGGASGLSTIRILKDSTSYKVLAADIAKDAPGLYLADKKIILPRADSGGYIDSLRRIINMENIDLVIPNVDEELPVLAANKNIIPQALISPVETINICSDKLKTVEYLRGVISVPKIFRNVELISDRDFPIFIKPRKSRGSKNVFTARNRDQLLSFIGFLNSTGFSLDKLILSEFLPGKEYTIEVVCDLNTNYVIGIPRVRLSVKGGVCSVGEVVKNNKAIEMVQKIVDCLSFVGPINIQVKEDSFGELKIMEINPRVAGSTSITYKCGVNIPLIATKLFFNEEIEYDEMVHKEEKVFRYLTEV